MSAGDHPPPPASATAGQHLVLRSFTVAGAPAACLCAQGDGRAAPWLLIHGAGHDHGVWGEVAGILAAAGQAVFVPDLPAHGASAGPARGCIEDMRDWMVALLDVLGVERVRLAGHSMGSLVALALAAVVPARCEALALVGSSVPMKVASFLMDAVRDEPERAFALISKLSFAPEEVSGIERCRGFIDDNLRRLRAQGSSVLMADLLACDRWQGGLDAAAAVISPVALVGGGHDRMTPPAATTALAELWQSRGQAVSVDVIAAAGHGMLAETPDEVAKTLLKLGKNTALCAPDGKTASALVNSAIQC